MAIHFSNTKPAQSKQPAKSTATATAPEPRWVVQLLKFDGRVMAYLGVLSYPVSARLTGQEVDAVKTAFDPNRKSFRFLLFWPGHPLHGQGRAWYYLADVDGKGDLPEVEALVEAALASAGSKRKAKTVTQAEERQAAEVKASARVAGRKAASKPAAKKAAKPAAKPAKKAAFVL